MRCRPPTETVMFFATASEKPGALADDLVNADTQRGNFVVADAVGLDLRADCRRCIRDGQSGVCNRRAAWVAHSPQKASVFILGMQFGRRTQSAKQPTRT